jgi:hypothetical protein
MAERFRGMTPTCFDCRDGLFCPRCAEDYGQGFAREARREAFEEAATLANAREDAYRARGLDDADGVTSAMALKCFSAELCALALQCFAAKLRALAAGERT